MKMMIILYFFSKMKVFLFIYFKGIGYETLTSLHGVTSISDITVIYLFIQHFYSALFINKYALMRYA